jgi:hypothetical protein
MPPTDIQCSKPRRRRSRNRGSRKQWRGSHEGYSGDTECTMLSPSEDECSVAGQSKSVVSHTTTSTSLSSNTRGSVHTQFYGDMPKRRNRDKLDDSEDVKTTLSSSSAALLPRRPSRNRFEPSPCHLLPRTRFASMEEGS